jgi:hypothetical protein
LTRGFFIAEVISVSNAAADGGFEIAAFDFKFCKTLVEKFSKKTQLNTA